LYGLTALFDGTVTILNLFNVDGGNDYASLVVTATSAGDALVIDIVVYAVTTLKCLELVPDNGFASLTVTPANVLVDQAQFSAGVHQ
jgi:hypothetical protein